MFFAVSALTVAATASSKAGVTTKASAEVPPKSSAGLAQQQYYAFNNIGGLSQKLCVRGIVQSADGIIWMATETGLYSYDGYHLIKRPLAVITEGDKITESLLSILVDGDSLLIGSNNGVLSFSLNTYRFSRLSYSKDEMIKGVVKADSSIWVATRTAIYRDGNKLSPSPDNIISLFNDSDFLYIGTANAVHRYFIKSRQSEKIIDGVNYASCFYSDNRDSLLWIGSASKVAVWDKKVAARDKQVSVLDNNVTGQSFDFPVPVAKSLCGDKFGNVLAGTDNGLYIVGRNRRVRAVIHDARRENSLAGDAVWSLFRDRSNNIWIGTNSGVSVVQGDGLMTTYSLPSITGEGAGNQFFCAYSDTKGRKWLGGVNGLICLENLGRDNQTYRWYRMNDERYPIFHNRIRVILEDSKGSILIGGDMGLMLYDEDTQRFRRFTINEDAYNWVYDIRETGNGLFEITTFTATYVATLDYDAQKVVINKTIQRDDLTDRAGREKALLDRFGLADSYLSAHYDSANGTVLLGGTDRFSILNTKLLSSTASERALSVTDIRINGESFVDRESITRGEIVLRPGDKIVEVMFSDFNFTGELTHNFVYRIDDGEWVPVHSANNSIMLTNLNPGKYNLFISYSDNTDEAISFELRVRAVWYASSVAKVVYLLIIICLIYGTFLINQQRKRIIKERAEHQDYLLKVKQKEKELLNDNEYLAAQLRIRLQTRAGEDGVLSEDEKVLLKITKMIEDNMSDFELNVNTLCEISGISSKQLYRKIKSMTGMTTVAYIRDQRLKKAASLLAKGNFTVSEVMYMVGFSNPSYFTRCFTEEYKIPPSEYK